MQMFTLQQFTVRNAYVISYVDTFSRAVSVTDIRIFVSFIIRGYSQKGFRAPDKKG